MELKSISYSEYEGQPQEWRLEKLELGSINLLVGKNASGKTRVLNVINGLAKLFSSEIPNAFVSGNYDAVFVSKGKLYRYILECHDRKVVREEFVFDGKCVLRRGPGGGGTIFAKKENRTVQFQTPEAQLAVVARRDSLQHPFFECLHTWGKSLRHFAFGEHLGKKLFAVLAKDHPIDSDPKSTEQVISVFRQGTRLLGKRYKKAIMEHMAAIGYPLLGIGLKAPSGFQVVPPGPPAPQMVCLYVKEKGLRGVTEQHLISQGMFRALSLIIQLTYSQLSRKRSCVLIDDIGEGLDFERSCALLQLITTKFRNSCAQLIMATNDRFVMNSVPLQAWIILDRKKEVVSVYSYQNARKYFDEFKYTGMSNFDFFSMNFINKRLQEDEKTRNLRRRPNRTHLR